MNWEAALVLLNTLCLVGFGIFTLTTKSFFPKYLEEKAKNLATKEDLVDITKKVEEVKLNLNFESEKIRSKRKNYEELNFAMGVFLSGRATDELKNDFLKQYSTLWLWAPDSVIKALNRHIDIQISITKDPKSFSDDDKKKAYANCIIEIRKDCGYPETNLNENDYKFIVF